MVFTLDTYRIFLHSGQMTEIVPFFLISLLPSSNVNLQVSPQGPLIFCVNIFDLPLMAAAISADVPRLRSTRLSRNSLIHFNF